MEKFIAVFMAPAGATAEWMAKPEAERAEDTQKMQNQWNTWMEAHTEMILESNAAGKNMQVTKEGITPVSNDFMLYSIIEAESQEAAAEIFINHPHFGIPNATIEVMPIRPL